MKITRPVSYSPQLDRLFYWYAFFIAFPSVVILQNISIYIFIVILFLLFKQGYPIFSLSKNIQRLIMLFALGAIASTIGGYMIKGNEYLLRSLVVLPNYIYWSFLIIILINQRNRLNFNSIYRAISLGTVFSIPYFFYFQNSSLFQIMRIFTFFTDNSFAFVLICFSPITIYYIKTKFGKLASVFFIIILTLAGFLCGSRSGSVLVFTGSFLAYFISGRLNYFRMMITIIFAGLVFLFLRTDLGENIVLQLNPRTHELIYSTKSTFETDRSYLIRRALVDKGLDLFQRYPITGIGLNNFGATEGNIKGDFEGAEYVINKGVEKNFSAHNSYISILSEGGIVMIVPFCLILVILIVHFFTNNRSMPNFYRPVFIGILMMIVHLYFISAILSVFGWFLIGLAGALVYREKENIIPAKQITNDSFLRSK